MIFRIMALTTGFILCCLMAQAAQQDILLGALEDVPGHVAGQSHRLGLRVLFRKTGREWLPYPGECAEPGCLHDMPEHFPATVTWNIGFSGHDLGRVTSQRPKSFQWNDEAGLQMLRETVPHIGKRSRAFAGWYDVPVYRPLVAVSAPHLKDPDQWRRIPAPADLAARLRGTFRKRFPRVSNCGGADDENPVPWAYRDSNVRIERFYASRRGWSVAEVALQKYRCDGPPDDAFIDQWFAVSPKSEIAYLEGGMHLLDAGDYDGDGKSEILFTIDRYNEGGYTLYYDDFRRHATFSFRYH